MLRSIKNNFIFFVLALMVLACNSAEEQHGVWKELRSEWLIFSDGEYRPAREERDANVIHFTLDPHRYAGGKLVVTSAEAFSIFLNHQLLLVGSREVWIDIDSLIQAQPEPLFFSVYQKGGLSWLSTRIFLPNEVSPDSGLELRPARFFLDFSILASLALLIFFVALWRTNPRLTMDYLNVVRLLSIQEREDTLLNSRISARINILYYAFISLLAGFILLIIFYHGSSEIALAENFRTTSLGGSFFQWIRLSLIFFLMLLVRLVLLGMVSGLFDAKELAPLQFYNYIRLAFFKFGAAGLVCVCYFIFRIRAPEAYSFLVDSIIFLLIFWVLMVGLKLMNRSSFRFFHLFSYLCASEIIPVVIMIKVLNS